MTVSVKSLITVVFLVNCLSGCAGYYRSKPSAPVEKELSKAILVVPVTERKLWKSTGPKYFVDERALSPGYQEQLKHPVDTEVRIYDEKTNWCGLTIWAIFPIPLWQPVCKTYIELTFQNGVPVSAREQNYQGSGFICGPFVPFLNDSDAPLSERFCKELQVINPSADGGSRRRRVP